jgi:hypothetical protein
MVPVRATTFVVLLALVASITSACVPHGGHGGRRPRLIDCSHAAERNVVEVSSRLDPSCTYTGGFDITRSDVVLDCRGALVSAPGKGGVGRRLHARRDRAQLSHRRVPQQLPRDAGRVP